MKKAAVILSALLITFLSVNSVGAAETMVFDSTNKYLGACDLTDTSTWTLERDYNVTKFEVWYSWNKDETTLPVTITLNGREFAKFDATRASCDPYQAQWCNADFQINKTFPKGTYTTQIPNKRQCLKPGGTGAIRLYEDASPSPAPVATEPSLIATNTQETETPTPNVIQKSFTASCTCTSTIVISVATASVISSLLAFLISKRKSN